MYVPYQIELNTTKQSISGKNSIIEDWRKKYLASGGQNTDVLKLYNDMKGNVTDLYNQATNKFGNIGMATDMKKANEGSVSMSQYNPFKKKKRY